MPIPANDPQLRLAATAFVIYYHKDLASARKFLLDFGFSIASETSGKEIAFSGYGTEPVPHVARQSDRESYFGGAAYEVESHQELERACRLPGASNITPLEIPGGGNFVRLTDPVGYHVYLVHGQTKKDASPSPLKKLVVNYEDEKLRKGKFHRFESGPAPVHRWGHYGVTYPEGAYETIGDKPITCFFHIDRGLEFTDHHAFFFKMVKPGKELHVAHAAFEVHDFDVQQLGHNYLESKGYSICWGVGRRVLGSQVLDYWFDSSEFILEHYADGDLVNSESDVSRMLAGPQTLSVWGPPVPEVF